MPINRKFDLTALRLALEDYYRRIQQRVTYEVILFEGKNDSDREVAAMARFARFVPCKINIIPYHSITFARPGDPGAGLRPSPRVEEIAGRLRAAHLTVMIRSSAGEDIRGACGQLAATGMRRVSGRHPGHNEKSIAHHHQKAAHEDHPVWTARGREGDAGETAR
jgi:23S rRNA (adenine2503-C2)-methyltransferase